MREIDQLVAEIALLKQRVETLEQAAYSTASEYVEGWTDAARLLGVSDQTCMNRYRDGRFPEPCGEVEYVRRGKPYLLPRWRRADLVRYAENAGQQRHAA